MTLRAILVLVFGLISISTMVSRADDFDLDQTQFALTDWLGRDWKNEVVRFPIAPNLARTVANHAALVDDADHVTPFEIVHESGQVRLEFLANLRKFGERVYRFHLNAEPVATDLRTEENADDLVIRTAVGGVKVRRTSHDDALPLAALRATDGSWVPLAMQGSARVASYNAQFERRGPISAVIFAKIIFFDGAALELRIAMDATDAAVQITETWSDWKHPAYQIAFSPMLPAKRVFYRRGAGNDVGKIAIADATDPVKPLTFTLEPWLHWWVSDLQGTWLTTFDEALPDALAIAMVHPDRWESDADGRKRRYAPPVKARIGAGRIELSFAGEGTKRTWLLAVLPRASAVNVGQVNQRLAPATQQMVIKHSDFPLDLVKDYRLQWPEGENRTRLLINAADLARVAHTLSPSQTERHRLARLPLIFGNLRDYIDYYLRSDDAVIGAQLSKAAISAAQAAVDMLTEQSNISSLGYGPHHQIAILFAVHLADFALADPALDKATKARIRAQLAFLAYVVQRPDYWAPVRNFGANPNMTTMVASYQGMLACLLNDHPSSRQWLEASLKELFDKELLTWSDEKGGWLEAPHYAMVSLDYMLGVFLCAKNSGRPQFLHHPRLRAVLEWLAAITTPPDERIGGYRHLPAIGNTYALEPTGQFGTAAYLLHDLDPAFSARMQWMHLRSGSRVDAGVGGFFPALAPYQRIFKSPDLPTQQPDYGSSWFPQTGAILRAHFGTSHESQMHIIAGAHHAHYDVDSGSITLWGKGRLLSDDFGYYGMAPASDHSMVDVIGGTPVMTIKSFLCQKSLDVVLGNAGPWSRRIALVQTPLWIGDEFFVMRDDLASSREGTWRLWLTGKHIEFDGQHAVLIGKDDVDLDIYFLDGNAQIVTVDTGVRTSNSSIFNKSYTTTQFVLSAPMKAPNLRMTLLLHPRRKSEPPPEIAAERGGQVVRVSDHIGTRTVFFASEPIIYREHGIAFDGTIGLIAQAADAIDLALGARGALEAFGERLKAGDTETDLPH